MALAEQGGRWHYLKSPNGPDRLGAALNRTEWPGGGTDSNRHRFHHRRHESLGTRALSLSSQLAGNHESSRPHGRGHRDPSQRVLTKAREHLNAQEH
jgi:hypothetical protein